MPEPDLASAAPTAAEQRHQDVLVVAAKLFRERGYQGASMDDIAGGVGLNKGTLYHYVDGKSSILFEIYRRAQGRALRSISEIPDDAPADQAVAEIIRIHLRSVRDAPNETAVYFQEMRWIEEWLDPAEVSVLRANERSYIERVTALIERGMRQGVFTATDAYAVAAAFVGITAWTYQWFDPEGPYSVEEIADVFIPMVLDGIAGRATGDAALHL